MTDVRVPSTITQREGRRGTGGATGLDPDEVGTSTGSPRPYLGLSVGIEFPHEDSSVRGPGFVGRRDRKDVRREELTVIHKLKERDVITVERLGSPFNVVTEL